MNATITLHDGPRAGTEVVLPERAVRSSQVLIPVYRTDAHGVGLSGVAIYEVRRYDPKWLCAMPLHLWCFTGWW